MTESKLAELLKTGEQFCAGKNYDRAIECFQSALKLNPASAEALNNLGVAFAEKGDLNSAADNFVQAVRLNPDDRETILNCADIHSALKRYDLAANVCGRYLKSHPADNEILMQYHLNCIKGFSGFRDRQQLSYELEGLAHSFKVKKHSLDPPSISIIVVTDNGGHDLETVLSSIIGQNYDKLECIVVSRESSGRVLESVQKFEQAVLHSLPGVNKVQAINSAISKASGDIVCCLEPGDELEPGVLSEIAGYFHRFPARSILAGDTDILLNNGETIQRMEAKEITAENLTTCQIAGHLPPLCSIFLRKRLFEDFGKFDDKYACAFDYDFYLRVSPCHRIYAFGKPVVKTAYSNFGHNQDDIRKRGREILSLIKQYKTNTFAKPKVSVIIPCYNYAEYLPYTAGSVIKQTFKDFEIIIVNDGSSDDTQAVAEKLIADNPQVKIKLISQENSGQPAISRNRGIANAAGEYILPLDGDDEIDPNLLAEAVAILDDNPQIALVYPDQTHVWPAEVEIFKSKEWDAEKFRKNNLLPHCALYRRHLWEDTGGYRTNVIGYEDWDFWIGCAEKGYLGQRLPKPYFIYRRHDLGVFATTGKRDKRLRAQVAVNHPLLFGEKMVAEAQECLKRLESQPVSPVIKTQPPKPPAINKTMDFNDLSSEAALAVIDDLNRIILEMKSRKLKISSWYGHFDLDVNPDRSEQINRGYNYRPLPNAVDDVNFPWFLYWELVWIILNADFKPGQKVLDLGGSSSLFSYYLASKGLEVTTVDLQQNLVDNGNQAAAAMNWNLRNYAMDMRTLSFAELFDHIVSVCVYEHIPMYDRVEINARLKQQLKPGGRFSITFDYRNPSKFTRFNTPQDVYEQFIQPSGLKIRGNEDLEDNGKSYLLHPFYYNGDFQQFKEEQVRLGHFDPSELGKVKHKNDYTFAALFLENS